MCYIFILSFLQMSVSQVSIMVCSCEPIAPKWMMIIMSASHICISHSLPQAFSAIPAGYLHFIVSLSVVI